ncbi:MAG: Uncharacterised protein [Flavobacteriia bacterium]|nr:MAG: Uncharacterised protein [Flavobacteriia bacterium]
MVGGGKMVALIEAVRQGSIYLAWQLSLVGSSRAFNKTKGGIQL